MENNFRVIYCRFHAKNNRKLLIKGVFTEDSMGTHKIAVSLDQKKIKSTTEKHTEIGMAQRKKDGRTSIMNHYFVWITLPDDWKNYKQLKLWNCFDEMRKEEYHISTERLVKLSKKPNKYIDDAVFTENGFKIRGWCLIEGDTHVKVINEFGRELNMKLTRQSREDVLQQYPECTREEVFGFELAHDGRIPQKVKVIVETRDKYSEYSMALRTSKVIKAVRKVKEYGEKAVAFYRQFGARDTIGRIGEKLSRKEAGSYEYWLRTHRLDRKTLEKQRKRIFKYSPCISICVPLYKTPEKYLVELIESIKKQTYGNWELCLSDGSGSNSPLKNVLRKYEHGDRRIKVVYNEEPLQISDNTNRALKIASGDWIAFADHDDLLAPNALYECVKAINKDMSAEMIYSDEDKVSMEGKEYFSPYFKSDLNIDLLRSYNYFCHLTVVKKELYNKVGELNSEFDGAQDYDFVLRCVEKTNKIIHIPKILYHWRAHKDSTAENPESKKYAFEAGVRAVQAHYERVGIDAEVKATPAPGIYRSIYRVKESPLVSVIIPNKDHIDDLDKCIRSFEEKSDYNNIEYVIVENNSEKKDTFSYYEELKKRNTKVKVVTWEGEFNYSLINNFGVSHASGNYYLFLNNDTSIINSSCIKELLGYCMREDVGAVGARLYYEDGTIQHAGVIVGLGGVAGHAFPGAAHDEYGYFGRIITAQNYSAVTAACMMVKKEVFDIVGGFEGELAVAFNDIDFCMKVREAGYLIVYNPYAELYHYESKSRGMEDTQEKIQRFHHEIEVFQTKWKKELIAGDPYYNPNLTLAKTDFSLAE